MILRRRTFRTSLIGRPGCGRSGHRLMRRPKCLLSRPSTAYAGRALCRWQHDYLVRKYRRWLSYRSKRHSRHLIRLWNCRWKKQTFPFQAGTSCRYMAGPAILRGCSGMWPTVLKVRELPDYQLQAERTPNSGKIGCGIAPNPSQSFGAIIATLWLPDFWIAGIRQHWFYLLARVRRAC